MDPIRSKLCEILFSTVPAIRIDRYDSLYIIAKSQIPDDGKSTLASFRSAGFIVKERGSFMTIQPSEQWVIPYGEWAMSRLSPSSLTMQLMKRRGNRISAAEKRCWIDGMKRVYMHDEGSFETGLRQTAAIALREKCGGALWVCGLCLDAIRQKA